MALLRRHRRVSEDSSPSIPRQSRPSRRPREEKNKSHENYEGPETDHSINYVGISSPRDHVLEPPPPPPQVMKIVYLPVSEQLLSRRKTPKQKRWPVTRTPSGQSQARVASSIGQPIALQRKPSTWTRGLPGGAGKLVGRTGLLCFACPPDPDYHYRYYPSFALLGDEGGCSLRPDQVAPSRSTRRTRTRDFSNRLCGPPPPLQCSSGKPTGLGERVHNSYAPPPPPPWLPATNPRDRRDHEHMTCTTGAKPRSAHNGNKAISPSAR